MKKNIALFAILIILVCGIAGVREIYSTGSIAYDGDTDVTALYENPSGYTIEEDEGGVASIIVKENLEKTRAANNVAAVVFDFRGFDTLGESFILLTAIAGSFVILSRSAKDGKGGEEE